MAPGTTPTTNPPLPGLPIRSRAEIPPTSPLPPYAVALEPAEPLANDYKAMIAKLLPVEPDLEIIEETWPTWRVDNWKELGQKIYLPNFECGGSLWRILLYPFGNNTDHVSAYIESGFENGLEAKDWYACTQFAIVLWNPSQPSKYVSLAAKHRFNNAGKDWGFTRFCKLTKTSKQNWGADESPLGHNGATHITAYVRVIRDPTGVLWHNFQNYDSKKQTGMVGLKNQGSTGYLNTILQPLFFLPAFRKAVYRIPTTKDATTDVAWALQRLFYSLQISKTAVSTQELTKSFGWDTRHLFEPQDALEMLRKLLERLEDRMKGVPVENVLSDLFTGKIKTYISCVNVNHESLRTEMFWDLELNVTKNKSLDDSFKEYTEVETLKGELQYFTGEKYGLQDAVKGTIFESFPPVLNISLKRYQYSISRDVMEKLNDYHEFPEEFDATPYLSAAADKSEPWKYLLVGVIVHDGDLNYGSYYTYVRPAKNGQFYKFFDDRVTPATLKEAMNENFGGDNTNPANKNKSAYILTYIRKSRLDHVLSEITKDDLPEHLTDSDLTLRKPELPKEDLHLNVGLISKESFQQHHGFDLASTDKTPGDPAAPGMYHILRKTTVEEFSRKIALEKGLSPERIRFWLMINRQNKTVRPYVPLLGHDLTFEEALSKNSIKGDTFYLWLEVDEMAAEKPSTWPVGQALKDSILVFLKYVDGLNLTVTGIGQHYVQANDKAGDLVSHINKIMKWPAETGILFLEEIKPNLISPMPPHKTFSNLEIQDGDIIRFQKSVLY